MISQLPKTSQFVFRKNNEPLVYFRRSFERTRKKLATKLQNPRLERISFKTLRHFKATMEYHRTKDILHVMQILGHKNITNTLVYTHLVNFESDDYICKVASTLQQATSLIERGFEFVTSFQDAKLFRKRK
jgi:integrase